jgi:hypothetical protein
MSDLQESVARSADVAGLHATVPALLLEVSTLLGALSATVTESTERGRRPFRPTPDWTTRLGELGYGVLLLADQTGVDLDAAVRRTSDHLENSGRAAQQSADTGWPFDEAR